MFRHGQRCGIREEDGRREAEMQHAMAVYYTASIYTECSTLGTWQVV